MKVKTFLLNVLTVCAALLGQACLLDIPPRREPLDELWKRWMLEGHYGRWKNGQEVSWDRSRPNTIHSYPEGAWLTNYGIEISETRSTNAGWHLDGGLIARIQVSDTTIELFGRETTRIHGPTYTAAVGRDYIYDFFLVVRPVGHEPGRLIKQWRIPPEELALTGGSIDPTIFQRSTRSRVSIETILHPARDSLPRHFVDGYLDFDPATKIATVTVTGLKRPFQERVDLSEELRQ